MSIPEGKCLNCGARYYGWALENEEPQTCTQCDGGEIITLTQLDVRAEHKQAC